MSYIETLSIRCTIFEIFDFKNTVTLKTELGIRQGHWKCHHAIERIRLPIDVLYGSILCHFWDTECRKMTWPWNWGDHSRSLKVAPFDRSCVGILVFFSNFVTKTHRFWDIRLISRPIQWLWNPGYGSLKVIENDRAYHSIQHPWWLPINVPYIVTIGSSSSYRFRDKRLFPSKIAIFPTPVYL